MMITVSDFETLEVFFLPGLGELKLIRTLHDTLGSYYFVYHDRKRIAKALCTVNGDVFTLGDIIVDPERIVRRFLFGFLPLPVRRVPLRTLGIGSRLLTWVIKDAEQRNCSRIVGIFQAETTDDTPRLERFYAHHGFRVHDGCIIKDL